MDLETFQENLLGTLVEDQETREEAINDLETLKKIDYSSFLSLALESIENPANNRIPPIAITYIYTEAKNRNLFEDEKSLTIFIDIFSANITAELLSEKIEDHFKNLLSTILALIHVYVFHQSEDLTIPNYILTNYTEIPQIKPYLMNCVYEISISDQELGGFDFQDLITILLDDLPNQSLFEPRIHLYFALAKSKPDLDIFHEMFSSLIIESILNTECSSVIIISIANFADINAYFFAPHINELFGKLLIISMNQEISNDIRESAIIAIMSIARNAPEMIASIENLYENVVAPLVLIVSEIDDNTYNDEEDDKPIYSLALDTIETIDQSVKAKDGFHQILQIYQSVLTESPPDSQVSSLLECFKDGQYSWQAKYALISSLSVLMNPFCDLDIKFVLSTFNCIIPYLDQQYHPLIHIAIYQYIKNTLNRINVKYLDEVMNETIQSAFAEESPIAKQHAFKTIASYFKNLILNYYYKEVYENFYKPYFARFIEEFQTQVPEINKYVVECVGSLARTIKEYFKEDFEATTQVFYELLEQSEDYSFSIKIISSFSTSLTNIHKELNLKDNPDFVQISLFFLQNALQLYGNSNINEEEAEELTFSIALNLEIVGLEAAPLFDEFLPNVIDIANKQIDIERSQVLEGIFGLTSMYTQIPSQEEGIKFYVSRNDIIEVKQALLISKSIIKIIPDDTQFIEQVATTAKNWISNDYFIEDLVKYSFEILLYIVNTDIHNLIYINFYLQCFDEVKGKYGSISYLTDLFSSTNQVLVYAENEKWQNQELFESILSGIPDLINYLIQLKLNHSDNMHSYNSYDFRDKKLHFITSLLSIVNDFISSCFTISAELTYQYISDMIPKISELLENFELIPFAACFIYNVYIYTKPEFQQIVDFIQFLIKTIVEFTHDHRKVETTEYLFLILGNTLFKFDLGQYPQFVEYLVNFFYNYISNIFINDDDDDKKDDDIEEENHYKDSINDNANVAFAKLLLTNMKYTSDIENTVSMWYDCKPIWDEVPDAFYYYQFFMDLIEEKNILERLDIVWEEEFLPLILKGVYPDTYGKRNLERLAIIMNNKLSTNEGKKQISDIINGMVLNYIQQNGEEDDDDVETSQQHQANILQNLKTLLDFDPRKNKRY